MPDFIDKLNNFGYAKFHSHWRLSFPLGCFGQYPYKGKAQFFRDLSNAHGAVSTTGLKSYFLTKELDKNLPSCQLTSNTIWTVAEFSQKD
jgi:hypothetical protein